MSIFLRGVRRSGQLADPNRVFTVQDGTDASEAKVFRAHTPPQGACENRVCALKLLANMQAGGDNLVDTTIFKSLQEQSRLNNTNAPGKFIDVDNQEALKNGGLERYKEVFKVVRPKFKKGMFSEAYVREVGDVLLSTPPVWRTADGDHRSWTKTGTLCVKPFSWASRERNGRSCTAMLQKRTKRSTSAI